MSGETVLGDKYGKGTNGMTKIDFDQDEMVVAVSDTVHIDRRQLAGSVSSQRREAGETKTYPYVKMGNEVFAFSGGVLGFLGYTNSQILLCI